MDGAVQKSKRGSRVWLTKTFNHVSYNHYATKRPGLILTCQRRVGEMLRLAALPLAVNNVEVHFDRVADGRVSVGRHLHEQHALRDKDLLCAETEPFRLGSRYRRVRRRRTSIRKGTDE